MKKLIYLIVGLTLLSIGLTQISDKEDAIPTLDEATEASQHEPNKMLRQAATSEITPQLEKEWESIKRSFSSY